MRWALPQPYEELSHTADAGVAVLGASPEEALARLVLALGALLAGGGSVAAVDEARLEVAGDGLAGVAVAALRELLYRFAVARLVPAWCEVVRLDGEGADLRVGLGRWDPERHREGADIKAVTYHAARFDRTGDGWRAQVIFDV